MSDKPRVWHTPSEDTNHGRLAMDAIEGALDAMAAATSLQDRSHWDHAACLLDEARQQCKFASAQVYRKWAKEQESKGYALCAHCIHWFPITEMTERKIERKPKNDRPADSTWLLCAECARQMEEAGLG